MDFRLPKGLETINGKVKDSIVLCCLSHRFFSELLDERDVTPVLMTDQLMYPGAFLLDAALEGWLKDETLQQLRDRAAAAYQKTSKDQLPCRAGKFYRVERGTSGGTEGDRIACRLHTAPRFD